MKAKVILLVEDNPGDIELTRRAFAESNLANELVVAEDGREALDYLFCEGEYSGRQSNELPTVVLLDLRMPRMDGLEFLQRIRADERTHRLPVVMLTTGSEAIEMAKSYDLGVNSYIRKPVDVTEFSDAIRTLGLYWLVMNEPAPPIVE